MASLGTSGRQPTASSSAGGDQAEPQAALAFARCMRQHDINLPDPRIAKDGIDQQSPTGVARDDPRLKAAEQACQQDGGLSPAKSGGLSPAKSGGRQCGGGGK